MHGFNVVDYQGKPGPQTRVTNINQSFDQLGCATALRMAVRHHGQCRFDLCNEAQLYASRRHCSCCTLSCFTPSRHSSLNPHPLSTTERPDHFTVFKRTWLAHFKSLLQMCNSSLQLKPISMCAAVHLAAVSEDTRCAYGSCHVSQLAAFSGPLVHRLVGLRMFYNALLKAQWGICMP